MPEVNTILYANYTSIKITTKERILRIRGSMEGSGKTLN